VEKSGFNCLYKLLNRPCSFLYYLDDLLLLLKKAGFGCYIGAYFVGALDYADDIVRVAPSAILLFVKY